MKFPAFKPKPYDKPTTSNALTLAVGGVGGTVINGDGKETMGADALVGLGDCSTDFMTTTQVPWAYDAVNDEYDIDGSQGVFVYLTKSNVYTSGKQYLNIFEVDNYGAGNLTLTVGGTAGTARTADGVYAEILTAGGPHLQFAANSTFVGSVTNLAVIPITNPLSNGIQCVLVRYATKAILYTLQVVSGVITVLDATEVDLFGDDLLDSWDLQAGWINANSTIDDANSFTTSAAFGNVSKNYSIQPNTKYNIVVDIDASVGGFQVQFGGGGGLAADANGTFDVESTASASGTVPVYGTSNGAVIDINTLEIREIPAKTLIALKDPDHKLWVSYDGAEIYTADISALTAIIHNKRHYAVGTAGTFGKRRYALGAELEDHPSMTGTGGSTESAGTVNGAVADGCTIYAQTGSTITAGKDGSDHQVMSAADGYCFIYDAAAPVAFVAGKLYLAQCDISGVVVTPYMQVSSSLPANIQFTKSVTDGVNTRLFIANASFSGSLFVVEVDGEGCVISKRSIREVLLP